MVPDMAQHSKHAIKNRARAKVAQGGAASATKNATENDGNTEKVEKGETYARKVSASVKTRRSVTRV